MKSFSLLPLLFLSACASQRPPALSVRPLNVSSPMDNAALRCPEIVRAYHLGRGVEPDNDLLLHGEQTVYRVESASHWNLHPGPSEPDSMDLSSAPRDAAFMPFPVNDAILAEVNAQKIATVRIMAQSRALAAALAEFQTALQTTQTNLQVTAALRASLKKMEQRLAALETAPRQPASISPTNEPAAPLSP